MSAASSVASPVASPGPAPVEVRRPAFRRPVWKIAMAVGTAALVVVLIGRSSQYEWQVGRFIESTNDAYLKADSTIIAPKVSGYMSVVLVDDNQHVEAGQVLARIDDRDFRANLDQATAKVAGAAAEIQHLEAQLAAQAAVIAQAQAGVVSAQASLELANIDNARYDEMARVGYGSEQQAQQASTHLREHGADLSRQEAALLAAQRQIDVLKTQRVLALADLEQARAVGQRAQLDVDYTTIVAPIAGTVGARTLRVGQFVQAGTQLMALVPLRSVYVVANFKETQLGQVRSGEPVTLHVDTFSHDTLRGYVDSVAPVSGLEFSLLPPDNATGNFTKIVQRIPVKIDLDPSQPLLGQLRPGMSVEAEIDTREASVAASSPGTETAALARH
jgi:membrane fusion protein (multidrug efflux system)